jgi:hypothetical protein
MTKIIALFVSFVLVNSIFSPSPALAQYCDASNQPTATPTDHMATAIGCVPFTPKEMVSYLLGWAVGIAGGIAFLAMVYAAIQVLTSSGDPKRIKAGQELLTAAVSGLVLIAISVVALNFIGVKVLALPGFHL